jgi:predicted PurR-regulated permease PerM
MTPLRADLARNTLGVLFIGMLMLASGWILRPFIAAIIWATMIVVATWPFMMKVQGWCGSRRGPAVAVMTLAMLVVFLIPLGLAINVIAGHAGEIAAWVRELPGRALPDAPAWLGGVPLVGQRAVKVWEGAQASGMPELLSRLEPYAQELSKRVVADVSSFGLLLLQFLLIVILSAVFYSRGEAWGAWLRSFGRRLADDQGEQVVVLAGQAIRGVALGVVVTAIVQSALGGIGLAIAGVPFSLLLTAIMFALCIAQLGPILVLAPSTIWLYVNDGAGWGTFMLVWSLVVTLMDNFLRPVLIRRGADLPLLLIIGGVIGGLVAFGLVGLFVGPVVLAVTYTLVDAWVHGEPGTEA